LYGQIGFICVSLSSLVFLFVRSNRISVCRVAVEILESLFVRLTRGAFLPVFHILINYLFFIYNEPHSQYILRYTMSDIVFIGWFENATNTSGIRGSY